MVYWGRVKNGKVVLEKGSKLSEGAIVRVVPVDIAKESEGLRKGFRLSALAIPMGVKDLASEADHYLYGTPKSSSRTARPRPAKRASKGRKS
jgi:hypothetical protein